MHRILDDAMVLLLVSLGVTMVLHPYIRGILKCVGMR